MDGTALITSKAGWKWDDIVLDIGMRFSDIDHQELVYVARTIAEVEAAKPSGRIAGSIACPIHPIVRPIAKSISGDPTGRRRTRETDASAKSRFG